MARPHWHITHRSLMRACDGPSCHCPAPLSFLGSYRDDDLFYARRRMPWVGCYLCRSCDEVVELHPSALIVYRYSTSVRPRPRRRRAA